MSKRSSSSELEEAVQKLEAFSRRKVYTTPFPALSKTIAFMRAFWHSAVEVGGKSSAKEHEKKEVLHSVEVINRARFQLQKLHKGDSNEQKLAATLTAAIESYNQCICNGSINEKLPGIHLPQHLTVKYQYPPQKSEDNTLCAMNAMKPMALALSRQSTELFHMKVLALLERYGIASNPEARAQVKLSPIFTAVKIDDESTCTLTQTLTLFPGQTIVVMGSSALDPKTQSISRLFPDTFSISLESAQTGFPDPAQHTGWALANQLIPDAPQRMDLLPYAAGIFAKKRRAIQGLLPQGCLIGRAKKMLKLKKRVFGAHSQEFISLHHNLLEALIHSSPERWLIAETSAVLTNFETMLNQQKIPFEWLVETNRLIRDVFIAKPYQALLDVILQGKEIGLTSQEPATRYLTAQSILQQAFESARNNFENKNSGESYQSAYIASVGSIIGQAAQAIILQHLSEDLMFSPPNLNLFEKNIQVVAYRQIEDFINELDLSLEGDEEAQVYLTMKRQLEKDTEMLQATEEHILSCELANYYQNRFASLKL